MLSSLRTTGAWSINRCQPVSLQGGSPISHTRGRRRACPQTERFGGRSLVNRVLNHCVAAVSSLLIGCSGNHRSQESKSAIASISWESMLRYLSTDIIWSKKRALYRERSSRKTVSLEEQIMSKDKYPSYFRTKWRLLCLLYFKSFSQHAQF